MPRGLNSLDWFNKDFQKELETQLLNGATPKQLAEKYGKGQVHFTAMLKMIGFDREWRRNARNKHIRHTYLTTRKTHREIADELGVSEKTIGTYVTKQEQKEHRQRIVQDLYLGNPNMHITKIAESVGVKPATIYSDLHELDLMV